MAEEKKQVRYDVDGDAILTDVIRKLLNEFPLLKGDKISFATLGTSSGKAVFPISGAVIQSESRDILGTTRQVCLYPFVVVYRVGGLTEERKAKVKTWLDQLGCWLERQPIMDSGKTFVLDEYPELGGSRKFIEITRQSPAYLDNIGDNNAEDWAIQITARYRNEFIGGKNA